jgi:DNA ligase-1
LSHAPSHLRQAQNRKVGIIMQLLAASEGEEAKFVVRALSGKMRLGLAERTVVVALAHASVIVRNSTVPWVGLLPGVCGLTPPRFVPAEGAKLSSEQLKEKLDEGVGIVKAVYRCAPSALPIAPRADRLVFPSANCPTSTSSSRPCSNMAPRACATSAS